MTKPTILVDVDEVVADLLGEWIRRYNHKYNDRLAREDITDWNLAKFAKPECGTDIYKILGEEDIYDYVQPYPGAIRGVEKLREIGDVVFVTSCNVATMKGKVHWLERYGFIGEGPRHDDLIIAHNKALIRGDILIDDGPHNLRAFPGKTVVFNQPYNTEEPDSRVYDWFSVPPMVDFLVGR